MMADDINNTCSDGSSLQPEDPTEAWVQFCKETAQPCYTYFRTEVMGHSCINLFRATQLCNPEAMKTAPKDAAAVRELVEVLKPTLLSDELLDRMIQERLLITKLHL